MTFRERVAGAVSRGARAIRDVWLIAGIALVIFVCLETAYRLQGASRRLMREQFRGSAAATPYADSQWYHTYSREFEASLRMRWEPYVYYRRRPFTGVFVNVDSLGNRRTAPAARTGRDTLRVFFFGGSTMWGTNQRDTFTIASRTAQLLVRDLPRETSVAVTNFGESGYISSQEVAALQVQLRRGNVPDVVVFFDGINDVGAAAQLQEAGIPQNEFNRAREFEFGRAVFTGDSDWRAAGAIAGAIADRVQFVGKLVALGQRRGANARPPDQLAREVVSAYTANVEMIEGLSRAFGFTAVYVWQPTLHLSGKRPTPFEASLQGQIRSDDFQLRIADLHRRVAPMLDSAMQGRAPGRFVNQWDWFRADTGWVFTDVIGHNTEYAARSIADGFYTIVRSLVVRDRADLPARR